MWVAVSSHQIYVMHCILEPTSGMAGQLQLTTIVVYRAGRACSCHCHAHSPQHVRNITALYLHATDVQRPEDLCVSTEEDLRTRAWVASYGLLRLGLHLLHHFLCVA